MTDKVLRPIGNRVTIRVVKKEVSDSIIVPEHLKPVSETAEVVAVPRCNNTGVNAGDVVLFRDRTNYGYDLDGVEVIDMDEVFAVVKLAGG